MMCARFAVKRCITVHVACAAAAVASCVQPEPYVAMPPPAPPKLLGSAAPMASSARAAEPPVAGAYAYPPTRKVDQKDMLHGVEVSDPYRWLEDEKSEEVAAWVQAQDRFAREWLAKLPLRDAIATRLKELAYVEAVTTPHHYGTRYFYTKREAGKEKFAVYRKDGIKGVEKILLDPNTWSTDGSVSLGTWQASWDGKKVAYTVKANNSDEAVMHVIDVDTGKPSSADVIEGAKYAHPSWTPKGDGFYYTWIPTNPSIPTAERPGYQELRFHKLGQDSAKDVIVHPRTGDPKSFLSGEVSKDGRWLVASVRHGWSRSDVYYQDLRAKEPRSWKSLVTGQDALYEVSIYRDRFYVQTNEGASRWRMLRVDPGQPARDKWVEIVPERQDATLEDHSIVGGRLSVSYVKDVVSHLEVHELDGKLVREVTLPLMGTASTLVGDPDADEAYFSFASFTYPTEITRTSVRTGASEVWYRTKVPVEPSRFAVEQTWATSKDGTKVPLFIVRPNQVARDGRAPTILFGYGGFQIALTPSFNTNLFPWVERGGVYVIANLRGGSEYGESWHRAGMAKNKQNVFDDFVAVAETLIRGGYTQSSRLVIRGSSNGGLLVGAAMTQHPDLFRVVLCGVPLLDMVRYHQFGSGKTWIEEYGSADDPDEFKALLGYSPTHHVTPGTKYPALLVLGADSDDRVDPMHARKFTAAMQAASVGGPVLLRIEKKSGHGGADLVRATVEKLADEYAFALSEIERP